ncbi:glutamate 5-kinase [Echinimonas agarilytica]|uniref:Glutamate 5-kinase n=1 Tax=Echinimonas agarilytica TaxID=1215918 RepID=A0AA41W7A6_9GAMM|nr:glutamate 5-kinase [Echinimonas agarilytica]
MEQSPYRRVVVKLGTSVLTGGSQSLDKAHMAELVRCMAELHQSGIDIIVCTSGAIAAGRECLDYPELPSTMSSKQLLAAVGQSQLIQLWDQLFHAYGIHVGQILLTREDVDDRERFLNARDTLDAMLEHRVVPIVNENDAVATQEIKVGDNDNLSALVSVLAEADLLMLLTDQSGLFTADPRSNPDAELICEVKRIDDSLRELAGDSGTNLGTGGMATKLQAADVARRSGIDVVIAAGASAENVLKLAGGMRIGTHFPALDEPSNNRKRWILAGSSAGGDVVVDDGAVKALQQTGSSLLPKGVVDVAGNFVRGDTVRIINQNGVIIARGISRYSMNDLKKIKQKHSNSIESVLGYEYGDVVIHRNDLILV